MAQIRKTIISTKAKIISSEPYTQEQSFITKKHFNINYGSTKWENKKVSADISSIYFPALDITFDKDHYNIRLTDKKLLIKPKNRKEQFNMFRYSFSMNSLSAENWDDCKLTIKNAVIHFGEYSKNLGNLEFVLRTSYFILSSKEEVYMKKTACKKNCYDKMKILDESDVVFAYEFNIEDGLTLSFDTTFPNKQPEHSKYNMVATSEGKFFYNWKTQNDYIRKLISFGQVSLFGRLAGVSNTGGIELYDATIGEPENSFFNYLRYLPDNVSIQNDGIIQFWGNFNCSFNNLGVFFSNSRIHYTKDSFILSGEIKWYDNKELGQLLPWKTEVEQLCIGFDGAVKELKIKENEYSGYSTLESGWVIRNKKLSVQLNQTKDKEGNLSPIETIFLFDDCEIISPVAGMQKEIPVQNLKYIVSGNSMKYVYDDVILPEGVELDLAKVFGKKQYNPEDTVRISKTEIADIYNTLDQECINLQRQNLFKLSEEYEYDKNGNLIHELKPDDDGEYMELRYEYDNKGRVTKIKNINTGCEDRYEYGYEIKIYRKKTGQEEYLVETSVFNGSRKTITSNYDRMVWDYNDRGDPVTCYRDDKLVEKWLYNEQNELIRHDHKLDSYTTEIEEYEYYNGLLYKKILKRGDYGTLYLYSYDSKDRLIKTIAENLYIDGWFNFRETGNSFAEYFKYNEHGELAVEKRENDYTKMYTYEYYSNGRVKSKKVYNYSYSEERYRNDDL